MPRVVQQVLDQADELAKRFEQADPTHGDMQDATALRELRRAVLARANVSRDLATAVVAAGADGHSWAGVGAMVRTSGQSAREKYGSLVPAART